MTWRLPLVLATSAILASPVTGASLHAQAQRADSIQQPGARRQALEDRFRQRSAELVRRRLQLTDDQAARLQAANRQFEQQRMGLLARERELRRELRQQLMAGANANETRVGELLDQTIKLQRQRLEVAENEQRELSTFLKPIQRARYFGLQNEMRRRMQELQRPGAQRGPNRRRQGAPNRPSGLE